MGWSGSTSVEAGDLVLSVSGAPAHTIGMFFFGASEGSTPLFQGTLCITQLPRFVDRYLDGRIKLDEMVDRELPLERINEAFELMHQGEVIRSVIRY